MTDGTVTRIAQGRRAAEARAAISARFLAVAEETTRPPVPREPLGIPAHLSLKSMRFAETGVLIVPLYVPPEYAAELYPQLAALIGYPLAVSLEVMDLTDLDDPLA